MENRTYQCHNKTTCRGVQNGQTWSELSGDLSDERLKQRHATPGIGRASGVLKTVVTVRKVSVGTIVGGQRGKMTFTDLGWSINEMKAVMQGQKTLGRPVVASGAAERH